MRAVKVVCSSILLVSSLGTQVHSVYLESLSYNTACTSCSYQSFCPYLHGLIHLASEPLGSPMRTREDPFPRIQRYFESFPLSSADCIPLARSDSA